MESVRTIYQLGLEYEISHPHSRGCTQFSLSIRRSYVDTLVLWLIGLRCVTLSLRHPYYEKVADEIVCHSYPIRLDLGDILFFMLAASRPCHPLTTSGLRPDHHSKYGILLVYPTLHGETVCKPAA